MVDAVSVNDGLRYQFSAETIEKRRLSLVDDGKCSLCYLIKGMCVCNKVKGIFALAAVKPKASISVLMHNKQWGRGNNTGKLLAIGLPHQAQITLFGEKEQEARLLEALEDSHALILYPSKDSKNVSEFREWYQSHPNVTIVVLDSTWSQSQTMNNHLPADIPRVYIDSQLPELSHVQNNKEPMIASFEGTTSDLKTTKVSTIDAVALALKALGEPEDVLKPLLAAHKLNIDAVLQQGYQKPVHGHKLINIDAMKPSVQKPDQCFLCGANDIDVNFKNVGMRKVKTGDHAHNFGEVEHYTAVSTTAAATIVASAQQIENHEEDEESDSSVVADEERVNYHRTWKCGACKGCFTEGGHVHV